MLVINGNSIKLTRGDTAYLEIPLTLASTGEAYDLAEGDKLELSVKRSVDDTTYALHKESVGHNTFKIIPEDTNQLAVASYRYDVQLTKANGDVFTVIGPASFTLTSEVTRNV